jgi:hypothetical protein
MGRWVDGGMSNRIFIVILTFILVLVGVDEILSYHEFILEVVWCMDGEEGTSIVLEMDQRP